MNNTPAADEAKHFLDITTEVCPMTFVRTKLLIERIPRGDVAEIRLRGAEPLGNVPRSLRELGHQILALRAEPGETAEGVHRLIVRKA